MFCANGKDGYIMVPTNKGYIEKKATIYPEGVAVFRNTDGQYYAVESKTGYAIYSMGSVYNLMATIRDEENVPIIKQMIQNYRAKYKHVNE